MSKNNLYELATKPPSYWQGYGPIQAELFIPFLSPPCSHSNLSEALVLAPCHCQGSLLPSLCACDMHIDCFLLELSLLALLLAFRCSGSRSLCAVFSVLLIFCHIWASDMHAVCFLPELSVVLVALCWAIGLSVRNKTTTFLSPCMPIMILTCRQTDAGHTDKRTHGQTNFRWTNKCTWGSLTHAPN